MEKNIILAGVGGQGILSIAYVIDHAALDAGFDFKQAEVHGMAQRGGAVQSHLRYADKPIHSDLIPEGKVDIILAVEPLEAMRYRPFLSKDGWVVSSVTPFVNIPDYPEMEGLLGSLTSARNVLLVDSERLARAAGNPRAQNMVMVGAGSALLDFEEESLLRHVRALFERKGERIVSVNEKAFKLGRTMGRLFLGLTEAGLSPGDALRLTRRFDPEAVHTASPAAWGKLLADDPARLSALLEAEGDLPVDPAEVAA